MMLFESRVILPFLKQENIALFCVRQNRKCDATRLGAGFVDDIQNRVFCIVKMLGLGCDFREAEKGVGHVAKTFG